MKKTQTKLLVLILACISCVVFFAALVVRGVYEEYVSLSNFQVTSRVSLAAGLLANNITDERQAAYSATTFSGDGTPAQLLEKYKSATEICRNSLRQVRELAAANEQRFSAVFKEGLKRALEAEAPLEALRKEILDPSRPQVQDLSTPLKTKALVAFDTVLSAQANFLPMAAMETDDGALVRKILTRDNISRLQKDVWKMRGIVASSFRRKAIEPSAPAELAMKMLGEADHVARLYALADPPVVAILDRIVKSADYAMLISYCRKIRERQIINSPDAVPAEEALAFQAGPSARLETSYNELAAAASQVIEMYTNQRLASARTNLIFFSGLAVFAIAVITGFIVYITHSITRPLRRVSSELGTTAARATQSAEVIAQSSGQLSSDACEQAAALEEIAASMNELSGMNTANLGHVRHMAELAGRALQSTDRGKKNVAELSEAMAAIQHSTGDVASILKTIDEIAFQTNILALNAAVEAARAGEAGAGFAVVADEVRTLAQRSAKAAQETAQKIESAVKNSARGEDLGRRAADHFEEISTVTSEYHKTVKEVEASSNQTTLGLHQVSEAVQKVDQITQRTAATAEENASASTEMHAQVDNVFDHIRQLESMVLSKDEASAASSRNS